MTTRDRIEPSATYRIQLGPDRGFDEVIGLLDHLRELGISHLYLSPIGTATPGSTHGYDWVPPCEVSPLLGGLDALTRLRSAALAHGIGIIIDIVPNHTGIADVMANPWFADVLRHGPSSAYADHFDLDLSGDNGADGKIALPVLGSGEDLTDPTSDSALEVGPDCTLVYHGHRFPTHPDTVTESASGEPLSAVEVHEQQHYRLVAWDSGLIGYRRFFAVNELAALRQESPNVFADTHDWVAELVAADLIDGVRVDHPDGLWDPAEYLRRLRELVGPDRLIHIEKILAPDEELEPSLPVDGTTGYEQLRIIDAVFTPAAGVSELSEIHEVLTGTTGDARWMQVAGNERKRAVLGETFRAEHRRLVRTIASAHPALSAEATSEATGELISGLGVYRADYPSLRQRLIATAETIRTRRTDLGPALDAILRSTAEIGEVGARLAQVGGAVTAKAVEDGLFYRTARLISAQEVGSDPANPAVSVHDFHEHNIVRAQRWPRAMTATSTHDTKRGEDVRARISLIAQVPERWHALVRGIWRRTPPPDPLTGYFLLQNVVGVWPVRSGRDGDEIAEPMRVRLADYTRKAIREAGIGTSWTAIDEEFESTTLSWVRQLTLGDNAAAISGFTDEIEATWLVEAISRKAVAALCPGVPDIYQGTQWWEDSLVDPDNRRPVDHNRELTHPKARVLRHALELRRRHPSAFGSGGTYIPLHADGAGIDHVIAFARGDQDGAKALIVAPRLHHGHRPDDTCVGLPPGHWRNVFDGSVHAGDVAVDALRGDMPVAICELGD